MLNYLRSRKRILMPVIGIFICLFLSLASTAQNKSLADSNAIITFTGQPLKDSLEFLDIFLLSSFDDSVVVSIGTRKIFNKFCKTDLSLGQAGSITVSMPEEGQMIMIYCVNENLKQTIDFKKGYAYIYVWKESSMFRFEFTNKTRMLE